MLGVIGITLMVVIASVPKLGDAVAAPDAVMFDDFSYTNKQDLKKNGWILRTERRLAGSARRDLVEDGVSLLKDA